MTQATDIDIREIKTAIDGNTKAIESIARATESNTRSVSGLSDRVESIAKSTEANTKAITDLTLEMRLGFANVNTQIVRLDGKIDNLDTKLTGKIDALGEKFDERTKGFGQRLDGRELAQRNIYTGSTVAIVGGLLLALAKYLFFGTLP